MSQNRLTLAALLALVVALGLVLWLPRREAGDAEPAAVGRSRRVMPSGKDGPHLSTKRAPRAPPRPVAARDARTWWREGRVKSLVADPGTVVVEAHWFKERPRSREAEPEKVFRCDPLVFKGGEATYRVDGVGRGWTRMFVREGARLRPLHLYYVDPWSEATPGQGLGFAGMPDFVGTMTISGWVRDKAGLSIPGARLEIREEIEGRMLGPNLVSDAEGRFSIEGSHGGPFQVSHIGGRQYQNHAGLIRFIKREFAAEGDRLEVVLQRNPRVRLRGRVRGHPEGSVSFMDVSRRRLDDPDNWRPSGYRYTHGLDLVVTPGLWQLTPRVANATVDPATTPHLRLDDEVELDTWVTPDPKAALLKVSLDAPGVSPRSAVELAVEASRILDNPEHFGGWLRHYDTPVALIPAREVRLNVRGALKVGNRVWMSETRLVDLEPGRGREVRLAVEPAVSIHVQGTPRARDGREHLRLKGPCVGDRRPAEEKPFRITGFANRSKDATWWCRPGAYVLLWEKNEPRQNREIPFEIKTGQSAWIRWVPGHVSVEVR